MNGGGVSDFHREVVSAVLPVIEGHGFALAGGNALLAHGISRRPTQDVNLFTDRQGVVAEVAEAVESALRKDGFYVERIDTFSELLGEWPELADLRAEWTVARGGKQVMLQIASSERIRPPVLTELGPVLDREDVLASKVCALMTRYEPRDYLDISAALKRYRPEELIRLAWSMEAGYTAEDFCSIGPALDQMDDQEFERYGLSPADVTELRRRFTAWPRGGSAS